MAIEITMPRLSDTMEIGTIIKWDVAEGDAVSSGDIVADVETDKATMELSVFDDGVMAKILVPEGQAVDVGTVIAVLAEEGEDPEAVAAAAEAGVPGEAAAPEEGVAEAAGAAIEAAQAGAGPRPIDRDRLRVSPVARRLAEEHKIDVSMIHGSGPGGRIIKRDVLGAIDAAAETAASIPPSAAPVEHRPRVSVPTTPVPRGEPAGEAGVLAPVLRPERIELSSMRQTIARRLVESKTTIPHYQVTMALNVDPLLEMRKMLNEHLAGLGVKLSVNDFLVRGCALAMHEHPDVNASWDGDGILVHGEVNVGVAIAVGREKGGGLVVATIRHADQKSLRVISLEARALAEKARTRGLTLEDMADSTFTISNLGMFGVDQFNAIINPPNSAILAVGAAAEKPVVRGGELTIGHEMTATMSSDHRVIDGAMAAQYLQTLRAYIENPATLMV